MYGSKQKQAYGVKRGFKPKTIQCNKKSVPRGTELPKGSLEAKVFEAFKLKPAGVWSAEFLKTSTGEQLAASHWQKIQQLLAKATLKSKKDVEAVLVKSMKLPEQKFIVLYEASLKGPLSTEGFKAYMETMQELFPNVYQALAHDQSPAAFTRKLEAASR